MDDLLNKEFLNRRDMLQRMSAGFGMLSLGGLASLASTRAKPDGLHHRARAKRVIFLFMNGGPSHVDTFDPKPALEKWAHKKPDADTGRRIQDGSKFMPSPFKFHKCGQAGIDVNETLPRLGRLIDDCCVIRSMHTNVPNHEPALLMMNTGNIQPIRPSLGAWSVYGLGTENENLPGFVVLRPSPKIVVGPALWSNSFLPAQHQATSVLTTDMAVDKLVRDVRNPMMTPAEQRRQVDLIQAMNRIHARQRDNDSALEAQIKSMETAYRMQTQAVQSFDIRKEPQHVRDLYGDSPFGRSVLLARRLVEDGVRFVSVYYVKGTQPWDTHNKHNQQHPGLCADSDQASAALIADLKQRGMLDDTLVIWGGEFGRTPFSQPAKKDPKMENAGRDHHASAFSMLLAGGGIKGGLAYGTSDEFGMIAEENPVHVHDLHATILHQLGIDHERLTYRWSGRDFRLTDVHGHVLHDIIA
tara:strand:- start:236 stop:1645 length:1410 start_codon:yes stop_codon:yes gene_type:complete